MAASLIIEEESGTYTARFRHPHNGYYAGDFSQTSRSGSELRVSYAERRDVPRSWQWCAPTAANPSAAQPAGRRDCYQQTDKPPPAPRLRSRPSDRGEQPPFASTLDSNDSPAREGDHDEHPDPPDQPAAPHA